MADLDNKKDNLFFIIATIILTITVTGLVLFIFYEKGFILNKEPEEEPEKKEKVVEIELEDTILKAALNEKIDTITNYTSLKNISNLFSFRSNTDGVFGNVFKNIDNEMKLHIVLTYLFNRELFSPLTDSSRSSALLTSIINNPEIEIKEISPDVVSSVFKEYFGTDLTNVNSTIGKNCLIFYYDATLNTYFSVSSACKDVGSSYVSAYKNKYTTNNDLAYVYVNYALLEPTSPTLESYNIYKDLEKTTLYQSNVSKDMAYNFNIDTSNYREFSEYRFTFKKDINGNYYFLKLEKTN